MAYDANSLSVLGGAVAALVAGKLLLNRYPNTWTIVLRCSAFWRYATYYALFGFLATWIMLRTSWGRLPVIFIFPSHIFWPVAVGLVSAFAKMTIVGAMPGADQFHFTVRAVLVLFEPGLLRQIRNEEYARLKERLLGYADRWRDLAVVVAAIEENLPDELSDNERASFVLQLRRRESPLEAMMAYLRFAGWRNFRLVFDGDPKLEAEVVPVPAIDARSVAPRKGARAIQRETMPDAMPRKTPIETQQTG